MIAKTTEKQTRKTKGFQPGQSGNPSGRPQGSRNKATLIAEQLIDGQAEELVKMCISMAKKGDTTAMKIMMDRLIPPRRDRGIQLALPDVKTPKDVLNVIGTVIKSIGDGKLDADQAKTLARILEVQRKSIETVEIEQRITALEKAAQR